jgi:hypothetical protein
MGLFNRRLKLPNGQMIPRDTDFSPSSMKETIKSFGLEPSESMRGIFGWTEEDDVDVQTNLVERKRTHLKERIAEGCNMREEMELEIKIDGMVNALKRKGIPDR